MRLKKKLVKIIKLLYTETKEKNLKKNLNNSQQKKYN